MIRIWFAAVLLPIPALSQGLGLKDYIGRMPTAPGTTIEQKVEILSHMGVRLNNEGYRELESLGNPVGRVHMPRIGGIEYDPMAPYRTAPSPHRVADALRRADTYAATRGAFGSPLKQPGHSMSRSTMYFSASGSSSSPVPTIARIASSLNRMIVRVAQRASWCSILSKAGFG